jgi:hypothetical protein
VTLRSPLEPGRNRPKTIAFLGPWPSTFQAAQFTRVPCAFGLWVCPGAETREHPGPMFSQRKPGPDYSAYTIEDFGVVCKPAVIDFCRFSTKLGLKAVAGGFGTKTGVDQL